jgi:hypothetical protein
MVATLPFGIGPAVSIDEGDINPDFRRVSADLAYWGNMAAQLHRDWRLEKLATKRLAAALAISKRAALETSGRGKVTISEVDAAVEMDATYQGQQAAELEAEFCKMQMEAFRDAIYAKKDMLVSLGAQMRAEMNSEPSIRRLVKEAQEL